MDQVSEQELTSHLHDILPPTGPINPTRASVVIQRSDQGNHGEWAQGITQDESLSFLHHMHLDYQVGVYSGLLGHSFSLSLTLPNPALPSLHLLFFLFPDILAIR